MRLKITDAPYFVKIPARLKITIRSKNYGLKIPVRLRIYARVYARVYDCGQIVIRTHDHDQHTPPDTAPTDTPTEHTTTGKRATTSTKIKFAYIIGMIAKNDKKMKKS